MADLVTITWDDVVAIAPHLSTASVAMQDAVIARVKLEVVSSDWGEAANAAAALLAAHEGTILLGGASGPSGPLTSKTVGSVSLGYTAPPIPGSALLLSSTSYGREFARLRDSQPAFRLFTGC